MNIDKDIYQNMLSKTNTELMKMVYDKECPHQSIAIGIVLERMTQKINLLEKTVLANNEQIKKRKKKVYYYEDVELTDELLVEYIDTEAFTIYELEKYVGAKKNVLRGRYLRAKKRK